MGTHRRRSQRNAQKAASVAGTAEGTGAVEIRQSQTDISAESVTAGAAPRSAHYLKPDRLEVLAAIESLYADQLKPFGRILRKRIAEHATGIPVCDIYKSSTCGSRQLPNVDIAHLKAVCDSCSSIVVQSEEGGDWSAALCGRPSAFVDIYSPEDAFSPELWAHLDAYCESLRGPDMMLPGGRYACAQAFVGRRLDFLAAFSLGQVCHIVQISISHRKILGYCNGAIVPYSHSLSMMKERCAKSQQACAGVGSLQGDEAAAPMPAASLEVARKYLCEILQTAGHSQAGPAAVPLSNIKRLFRMRYQTELSETLLGHSRLSDLLQDERFRDLCSLQLQKSGYVVVPRSELSEKMATISLAESLQLSSPGGNVDATYGTLPQPKPVVAAHCRQANSATGPVAFGCTAEEPLRREWCVDEALQCDTTYTFSDRRNGEPQRVQFCPDEPLCLDASLMMEALSSPLLALPTPEPSPGVPPSATVRKWSAWSGSCEEDLCMPVGGPVTDSTMVEASSPQPELPMPCRIEFCKDEPLCLEDAGLFFDGGAMRPLSSSPPTPLRSPGEPTSTTVRSWSDKPRRVEFCKDEPLCLEDAGWSVSGSMPTPLLSPGVPASATVRRWARGPASTEDGWRPVSPAVTEPATLFAWPTVPPCLDTAGTVPPAPPASFLAPPAPILSVDRGFPGSAAAADEANGHEDPLITPRWPLQVFEMPTLSDKGWANSIVQNTFIHAKLPPPTPVDARHRSHSVPKDAGSINKRESAVGMPSETPGDGQLGELLQASLARAPQQADPMGDARQLGFCPDEPLLFDGAGTDPETGLTFRSPHGGCLPLTVRNTFLHSAPLPPTPAPGTEHRSKSVPAKARHMADEAVISSGADTKRASGQSPGGQRPTDASAFPAFVPLSPALAQCALADGHSKTKAASATALVAAATHRIVRFA